MDTIISSKLIVNFNGNKYIITYEGDNVYYIRVNKSGIPIMNDIVRIMEFILGVKLISEAWSKRTGIKSNVYSLTCDANKRIPGAKHSDVK